MPEWLSTDSEMVLERDSDEDVMIHATHFGVHTDNETGEGEDGELAQYRN